MGLVLIGSLVSDINWVSWQIWPAEHGLPRFMSGERGLSDVLVSGADRFAWGWTSSAFVDRRIGEEFFLSSASVVCVHSDRLTLVKGAGDVSVQRRSLVPGEMSVCGCGRRV